jgi:hypothetical protein
MRGFALTKIPRHARDDAQGEAALVGGSPIRPTVAFHRNALQQEAMDGQRSLYIYNNYFIKKL